MPFLNSATAFSITIIGNAPPANPPQNNIQNQAKVILTYQGKILKEEKKIGECEIEQDAYGALTY